MTRPIYLDLERTHYGVEPVTKKKTPAGEHVTLSKETIAKLLTRQVDDLGCPPVITLTPFDMLELERSEARQAQAAALLQMARLERQVMTLTRQLHDAQAVKVIEEVNRASQEATEAHRKLADSMAERYHFSWTTHSYQPETGEVRAADPES